MRTKNITIQIDDNDGIEINREVTHIFQVCCDCGLKHRVDVEWKGDSVVLRYKRMSEATSQ